MINIISTEDRLISPTKIESRHNTHSFSPVKKIIPKLNITYEEIDKHIKDCDFGYEELIDEIIYRIRANKYDLARNRDKYMPLVEYCNINKSKVDEQNPHYLFKIINEHIKYNDFEFLKHYPSYKFDQYNLSTAINNNVDVKLFEHIIDNLERGLSWQEWSDICSSKNLEYMNIVKSRLKKDIFVAEENHSFDTDEEIFYYAIGNHLSSLLITNFFLDAAIEMSYNIKITYGSITNPSVACRLIFKHISVTRYGCNFSLTDEEKQNVVRSLEKSYKRLKQIIYEDCIWDSKGSLLPACLADIIASFIIVPRDEIVKILSNKYANYGFFE